MSFSSLSLNVHVLTLSSRSLPYLSQPGYTSGLRLTSCGTLNRTILQRNRLLISLSFILPVRATLDFFGSLKYWTLFQGVFTPFLRSIVDELAACYSDLDRYLWKVTRFLLVVHVVAVRLSAL